MSGKTASNTLDICGPVVAICICNALLREHKIYADLLQLFPMRGETSSRVIPWLQPCERKTAKENKTCSEEILWEEVILEVHLTSADLHSCTSSKKATSVQAPSSSNNDLLIFATAIQQIMTELDEAVSEKDKIKVVIGMVLNIIKQMAAVVHRPIEVIAFSANGIWRQRCDISKHLQDLHIDVTLLSETHQKPHGRLFIPNYYFF
jgi:hypothetical protein